MNKNPTNTKYFKQLNDFYGNIFYINNKNTVFHFPFNQDLVQLFHKILNQINFKRNFVLIYVIPECFNSQSINFKIIKIKNVSFFLKKIKEIKIKIVISLRKNPINKLLSKKVSVEHLRLKNWSWKKINLIVSYNPLDLLNNQDLKKMYVKI